MCLIDLLSIIIKKKISGVLGGLVVRILAFATVAQIQSLVKELRSCKPHGKVKYI